MKIGVYSFEEGKEPKDLEKQIEKLEEENNKLKQVINEAGIIKCCKCGEYHNKHYICWHCGYDYTAPKE